MADWQVSQQHRYADGLPRHVTRMWPKRGPEILDGGSIFWVIKGQILARQTVLRLDEVFGNDGIRRCAIVMEPTLHKTEITPRRAFQGWRYLPVENSPKDLTSARLKESPLPAPLIAALAEIGVR
ncbi:hypothetical protein RB2150_06403 [Rhodobacterales bacterium HTCC2150]|nr:hypothetical protein RB2150_06403 [Rhodobacterales bacterium HTCC2150] [Rhodobacteraceae bacterium HTCC2150]